MPAPTVPELKKALVQAGFEVYRARGEEVHLAERPRENLIMDSGVSVVTGEPMRVRFIVRAQKADFVGDDDETLFARARALGASAVERGFVETDARARNLFDPGDDTRVLDTWFEIVFERQVPSLKDAFVELRTVILLEKAAARLARTSEQTRETDRSNRALGEPHTRIVRERAAAYVALGRYCPSLPRGTSASFEGSESPRGGRDGTWRAFS